MSQIPLPPFDLTIAHRWFAAEFNNQAWELIESGGRSPEDCQRMVHLAHAAYLHWAAIGSPLNRQRAFDLLAHAYRAAGQQAVAAEFAEAAYRLSEQAWG